MRLYIKWLYQLKYFAALNKMPFVNNSFLVFYSIRGAGQKKSHQYGVIEWKWLYRIIVDAKISWDLYYGFFLQM
jgi:hypothetical protein